MISLPNPSWIDCKAGATSVRTNAWLFDLQTVLGRKHLHVIGGCGVEELKVPTRTTSGSAGSADKAAATRRETAVIMGGEISWVDVPDSVADYQSESICHQELFPEDAGNRNTHP